MMKRILRWIGGIVPRPGPREAGGDACRWRRDPLAHPALRAMSQRELADLQFQAEKVSDR